MKRPNRKVYIGKSTKIQLIADLELYIDHLELKNKQLEQMNSSNDIHNVVWQSEQLKAVEELANFARDVTNVCDLDRLEEIIDRL